ncbi:MAG: Gfo/Idh/MocA family oxidoreductase, partial [Phycisphaerales bacterium]|nr:Gfo/Idh/MocA family oxidoreductase [Phycisphaerales bacterium]
GVVGTGGMGHAHLRDLMGRRERDNLLITRVCDVYRRRLNSAVRTVEGNDATGTMEYRDVLDSRDVDVVLIATPDHWHTKIAIEAMDNGKDVYVEKPLSHTIPQALACRDAVHRTGRVLQVGPQGTSDGRFRAAQKAIREGRIGKVSWSQGSYCRNSRGGQFNWHIDPDAGPMAPPDSEGYVWWDRWLGHEWDLAPKIDWNADHFFRFRKYFAYNGVLATDLLYHKLAPLLLAISGKNGEYPKRVVASGGRYLEKDERDIPDTFIMTVDYPSEHTIMLASVMTNDDGLDDRIRGQYGTMNFDDGITLSEQSVWANEFRAANADVIEHATTQNADGAIDMTPKAGDARAALPAIEGRDHMGAFIDAVRGDGEVACNVDLGCSTMVAIKMAVEAYRQDRVMRWNADREVMTFSSQW